MSEITSFVAEQLWNGCLKHLSAVVPLEVYKKKILTLRPVSFVDGVFVLEVPSVQVYEDMRDHYTQLFRDCLAKMSNQAVSVDYRVLPEELWCKCAVFIRDNVDEQIYNKIFAPLRALRFEDNNFTIFIPSQFICETIEEQYIDLLWAAITKEIGPGVGLQYSVDVLEENTLQMTAAPPQFKVYPSEQENRRLNPFVQPISQHVQIHSQLIPHYTFDNFVEGESNRVARKAGMDVAKMPGKTPFNPMVVYAKVGMGKTHFLHAIGNFCTKLHPDKVVLYVSAQKFIHQFICYAKNKQINDFVHFYQLVDVLLVDDIQFFEKSDKIHDAFFAIFNHLHESDKQIVLTLDRPPSELKGVEDRLVSRFKWGLVDEIHSPDTTLKLDILRQRCSRDGSKMSEEVLSYLANFPGMSIRELEGIRLSILAQGMFRQVDLALAKEVVDKFVRSAPKKEISSEQIQSLVCEQMGIDNRALMGKSRCRQVAFPRQLAMYFIKQHTKCTLKQIGEQFGGRDHTTVLHACRTIRNLMEANASQEKEIIHKIGETIRMQYH